MCKLADLLTKASNGCLLEGAEVLELAHFGAKHLNSLAVNLFAIGLLVGLDLRCESSNQTANGQKSGE